MAAMASHRLQQRRPHAVYGKSHRKAQATNHADFFDDDDVEMAVPAPKSSGLATTASPAPKLGRPAATTASERLPELKERYPVAKSAPQPKKKGALPTKAKSPAKEIDPFDIPSSEDEHGSTVGLLPEAPKIRAKNGLVQDQDEEDVWLAPWEKRAARADNHVNASTRLGKRQEEEAAKSKPTERLASERSKKSASSSKQNATLASTANTSREASPPVPAGMSAREKLARLRARQASSRSSGDERSQPAPDVAKRSGLASETLQQPQSKRRRLTPRREKAIPDAEMAEPPASSAAKIPSPVAQDTPSEADIYDVPSDDVMKPSIRATARLAIGKASHLKARANPALLQRKSPRKSASAPEDLTRMLPIDDDLVIVDADPVPSGRPLTPLRGLNKNGSSPDHKAGHMTPKQTQAWANFFEPAATPSADMEKLKISGRRRTAQEAAAPPKTMARSSSDIPKRRARLVDQLKASAVSSSEAESSEDDDVVEVEDTDRPTSASFEARSHRLDEPKVSTQASQSQDLSTIPATAITRITYAKQRSYLAEESVEDGMMLDIPLETPQRPTAAARRVGKSAAAPKTTAFDLDDSGDEVPGGLRTIHELRAGGRNTRVMGEISALLGEIADHSASARSGRRSALLELATQLLDQTFAAEQFVGHGFEQHLLAESNAPADPIADFLLATAFLLLLRAELPAHTAQSFAVALPWLTKLLPDSADTSKVVRERRSNMSKSAQGDVLAFAGKVKALQSLWADSQLPLLSARLVAVRTIELLVSKLRGQGDRSELLDAAALDALIPTGGFNDGLISDASKALEASLTISVLEALSTLSAVSSWPDAVITAIATLPAVLAESWQAPQHTKWLAYRLCLNITNTTAIDQALFTSHNAVRHLLSDIVSGFGNLHHSASSVSPDADRALRLDLLVLAIGILINLAEHCPAARQQAVTAASLPALTSVVQTFQRGQETALEAESVEESAENVAYGYLAVMLANLCQDREAKGVIGGLLLEGKADGGGLGVLVQAVEDFVKVHQKVDGMMQAGFEGDEGAGVWSAFTERLSGVLDKLRED